MLIDLRLEGKTVLIVGGGKVGERKVRKFLQANSRVVVASKVFTDGLKRLGQQGKVDLVEVDVETDISSIVPLISRSNVVVAATDNWELNENIAREARKRGILVCAVDRPSISDFYLPAVACAGSIRIAVCTGGKSPAMARILRKRVEEIIKKEDVLQVELQSYARELAKSHISDGESRRNVLYQIIRDPNIERLFKEGNLEEAKALAKQIIERY